MTPFCFHQPVTRSCFFFFSCYHLFTRFLSLSFFFLLLFAVYRVLLKCSQLRRGGKKRRGALTTIVHGAAYNTVCIENDRATHIHTTTTKEALLFTESSRKEAHILLLSLYICLSFFFSFFFFKQEFCRFIGRCTAPFFVCAARSTSTACLPSTTHGSVHAGS